MGGQREHHAVQEAHRGETTALAAPVRKPAAPKQKPRKLPPYKVLLHNDDVNTFDHVIKTILMLTNLATEEAIVKTLEAHESGVALLLVTHRERAELYSEQFHSRNLKVTIEPAGGSDAG